MTDTAQAPKVYQAICNITEAMSKEGIAKTRKNAQQGYSFRGIDDVYAALSSLLAKNKLCMLPRVVSREVSEKLTKSGGTLFYTVLMVEFDFVSAEDGSQHTIATVGEAMDSGDKSSNKSQSAAFKYAALMSFCIPTEGDNDTENVTHKIVAPASVDVDDISAKCRTLVDVASIAPDIVTLDKHLNDNKSFMFELLKKSPATHKRVAGEIQKKRRELEGATNAAV
jgi:hypothetical protein